jgi:outer membrane receptor protein involved in Fe transport
MNSSRLPRRQILLLGLLALAPGATPAQEIIQLEKFEVTAQKRVQRIEDVPIPLTAYTGTFLDAAGVSDFKSLAPFVPGLFIQEQSPNNPGINIRGITSDSGDPRDDMRISIFQDGVSISRSRASVVELFDLERIEVLKGPQGTLFGRNAEIGAIAIIQNKPQPETSGSFAVGFGNFNERRVSGYYNAPLVPNRLLGRVAFTYSAHDGTIPNLADGSDLNGKKTTAVRTSLRWQPGPQTTADLVVNWQHDRPPGTSFKSGVIPTSRGDTSPFTAAELNRGRGLYTDRTVAGVTGTIEHQCSDTWSVTAITGWREYDAFENFDADGSRLSLLEFAEDATGRQFSQELRLNFKSGARFNGFVGASYFSESGAARVPFYTDERQLWPFLSGSFRQSLLGAGVPSALVDFATPALNPFVPQPTLPVTFAAFNNPLLPPQLQALAGLAGAPLQPRHTDEYIQSGRTRAYDIFLDGTWRPVDKFEFTAGLRVTREDLTSGYEVLNGTPPTTLGFIVNAIPGYPYYPSGGRREATDTATAWDGRAIARYEFSKAFSAYAGVARSRRPESLLVDSTSTAIAREEVVWNYEVGIKGTLARRRVQYGASAFQYDYRHFQTTVLSLGRFTTLDAGNATGRGFELNLQGAVADHINVFTAYGYTDATFNGTGDNGQPQQYAGYTFRLTPRHTIALGGTFTLAVQRVGRFFLTPIYQYKSQHYFEDDNAAFNYGLRQDGYSLFNLRAGWRSPDERWEVTAYADNLFDKEYLIDAGNTGGSFGIPTFIAGDPRRYGLLAAVRW